MCKCYKRNNSKRWHQEDCNCGEKNCHCGKNNCTCGESDNQGQGSSRRKDSSDRGEY